MEERALSSIKGIRALAGFCKITIPFSRCMAFRPFVPSELAPESKIAVQFDPKASAADSRLQARPHHGHAFVHAGDH